MKFANVLKNNVTTDQDQIFNWQAWYQQLLSEGWVVVGGIPSYPSHVKNCFQSDPITWQLQCINLTLGLSHVISLGLLSCWVKYRDESLAGKSGSQKSSPSSRSFIIFEICFSPHCTEIHKTGLFTIASDSCSVLWKEHTNNLKHK